MKIGFLYFLRSVYVSTGIVFYKVKFVPGHPLANHLRTFSNSVNFIILWSVVEIVDLTQSVLTVPYYYIRFS